MFPVPSGSPIYFSPLSLFFCVSCFPSAFSLSSTHFLWVSSPPPPRLHLLQRSAMKFTCNYTRREFRQQPPRVKKRTPRCQEGQRGEVTPPPSSSHGQVKLQLPSSWSRCPSSQSCSTELAPRGSACAPGGSEMQQRAGYSCRLPGGHLRHSSHAAGCHNGPV